MKSARTSVILKNRKFRFFLFSQGVSSFGDTFQIIAVTALIFKLTGSGLYAGFGLLGMPLCSLLFSVFSGSLADLINEKYVLIINDFIRGIIAILFAFTSNIFIIYFLLFFLAFLNVFYIPSAKKILVNILNFEELLMGNSILIGVSGAAYIIGPMLAGIIIETWNVNIAFWINGFSFIYSGVQIAFINISRNNRYHNIKRKFLFKSIIRYIGNGVELFLTSELVKELAIIWAVIGFGSSAVNFTFYSFAFNVLKVTNLGWGFMLSVFYGANFISFFISIFLKKYIMKKMIFFIYLIFLILCILWFCYGFSNDLIIVIILLGIEGITSALLLMFLTTRLQLITSPIHLGIISGINEILGNLGKIIGITMSYILMGIYKPQKIFIITSILCILYLLHKLFNKLKSGIIKTR